MKLFSFIVLIHLIAQLSLAQEFQNEDLEGKVYGFYSLPPTWEAIPFWDAACRAEAAVTASPDLTSTSEPSIEQGIIGIPYSGTTFVSGLDAAWILGGDTTAWHEGIQQTVNGFDVNKTYSIRFYQAVVKQIIQEVDGAVIDTSGSWAVYLDDKLIGLSDPSTSQLSFNNTYLNWQLRSVTFTPTRREHTFKFLPMDDDADRTSNGPDGRLRMGIDQISIELATNTLEPNNFLIHSLAPNPTNGPLSIQLDKSYNALKVNIFDSMGRNVAQQSHDQLQQIDTFIPGPPGIYLVSISIDQQIKRTFKIIKH